jgi:hypothetical protein
MSTHSIATPGVDVASTATPLPQLADAAAAFRERFAEFGETVTS